MNPNLLLLSKIKIKFQDREREVRLPCKVCTKNQGWMMYRTSQYHTRAFFQAINFNSSQHRYIDVKLSKQRKPGFNYHGNQRNIKIRTSLIWEFGEIIIFVGNYHHDRLAYRVPRFVHTAKSSRGLKIVSTSRWTKVKHRKAGIFDIILLPVFFLLTSWRGPRIVQRILI
jgi:hypothetical protein